MEQIEKLLNNLEMQVFSHQKKLEIPLLDGDNAYDLLLNVKQHFHAKGTLDVQK